MNQEYGFSKNKLALTKTASSFFAGAVSVAVGGFIRESALGVVLGNLAMRAAVSCNHQGRLEEISFLDDMKEQNGGNIVFVATSVGDYKVMAEDMQELKRYIKQLGEVVIYYRNVTMPDGEKGQGVGIEITTPEAIEDVRG